MSDAPRWPGADGTPDLIFAPEDAPERLEQAAAQEEPVFDDAADDTVWEEPAEQEHDEVVPMVVVDPYVDPYPREEVAVDIPLEDEPEPIPTFVTRDNPLVPAEASEEPDAGTADRSEAVQKPVVPAEEAEEEPAVALAPRHSRNARLRLTQIDPWSVMKTSFLFAIAFGVMLVVAVLVVWLVLAGTGALESANNFINTLISDPNGSSFDIQQYLSLGRVMGLTVLLSVIDIVILTALATLFAFLYNVAAMIIGGLEVSLTED